MRVDEAPLHSVGGLWCPGSVGMGNNYEIVEAARNTALSFWLLVAA